MKLGIGQRLGVQIHLFSWVLLIGATMSGLDLMQRLNFSLGDLRGMNNFFYATFQEILCFLSSQSNKVCEIQISFFGFRYKLESWMDI